MIKTFVYTRGNFTMCSIFAVFMLALLYPSINGTTNDSSHDVIEYLKTVKTTDCLESLHDVEQYVKSDPYNIESINNGFFPPNQRPSFWVTVNYYFNTSDNKIPIHPASFEAQYNCSDYCDDCNRLYCDLVPDFQFHWTGSPLLHFTNPLVMEVFKNVIHMNEAINNLMIYIVIPPICGDIPLKNIRILNTLTTKLKQFSSVDSNYKNMGISKIFPPQNDSHHNQTLKAILQEFNELQTDENYIIHLIVLSQYLLCFVMMYFVPVFLLKYFGLLPNTETIATNRKHPMFFSFWSFTTVSFSYILFCYKTDFDNHSVDTIFLFKAPSVIFLEGNLISACIQILINYSKSCHGTHWLYILTSVIITLGVQRVTFYIGWFFLSVITSPIYIVALSGQISLLMAISVTTAALYDLANTANLENGYFVVLVAFAIILYSISSITTAYKLMLSKVGADYEDGILAIMPTLVISFISWVVYRLEVLKFIRNQVPNEFSN